MKSLLEVAERGDNRELLVTLLERLCLELDDCESKRDIASLSNRIIAVVDALGIDSKVQPEPVTPLDEMRRRRASKAGR